MVNWLTVYIFICLRTIHNMILLGIYSTVLLIHNYSIKSFVIVFFLYYISRFNKVIFKSTNESYSYNVFSFNSFV